MGVQITLGGTVYNFFSYVPTRGIAGSYVSSIFNFWGTGVLFSIIAVTIYSSTNSAQMFTFLHILINTLFIVFLTIIYLICISLMFSNIEHLFMHSLEICISSLKKFPFKSYIYFLFRFFFILGTMSSSYILNINSLSDIWLANIFLCSVDCLLNFYLFIYFSVQKLFSLTSPTYLFLLLLSVQHRKLLSTPMSETSFLYFHLGVL